ncbi:hypothetical protein HK098_003077 [Nowakowskiella sp. JEL0407]|nr:hypothetical protein HK098_003077 [Nowakowskiella sp. JEL0407]
MLLYARNFYGFTRSHSNSQNLHHISLFSLYSTSRSIRCSIRTKYTVTKNFNFTPVTSKTPNTKPFANFLIRNHIRTYSSLSTFSNVYVIIPNRRNQFELHSPTHKFSHVLVYNIISKHSSTNSQFQFRKITTKSALNYLRNPASYPVIAILVILLSASLVAISLVAAALIAITSQPSSAESSENFKKSTTTSEQLADILKIDVSFDGFVRLVRLFVRVLVLGVIFLPVFVGFPIWLLGYYSYYNGEVESADVSVTTESSGQPIENVASMITNVTDARIEEVVIEDDTKASESYAFRFLKVITKLFNRIQNQFESFFLSLESIPEDQKESQERKELKLWWVYWLVWSCELAGPTFIKLGQYASSRTDVLPPEICAVLAKLQSSVSPHPLWYTKFVIKKEYGVELNQLFEEFETHPIGVGSIAQVYKAKLRINWKSVVKDDSAQKLASKPEDDKSSNLVCAIKILHPNVARSVADDISIIYLFATIIHQIIPGAEYLSIPQEVLVFSSMLKSQTNLRYESSNLQKFTRNFSATVNDDNSSEFKSERKKLLFPKPFTELTRENVLVETFLDAVPVGKFLEYGQTDVGRSIANIGLDCFLRMLIIDNFVHADLHPGSNIFVTFSKTETPTILSRLRSFFCLFKHSPPPPTHTAEFVSNATIESLNSSKNREEFQNQISEILAQKYTPHLIFLDAGLVCTLSPRNLRNFLDLFLAIGEFNGLKVGNLMLTRSRTPETCTNPKLFISGINDIIKNVQSRTLALSSIKFGDLLSDVFGLVREYRVKLEGDFVNVGVSVLLLEGIGRRLDPELDLLERAVPVLRAAALHGVGYGVDTVVGKVKDNVKVNVPNVKAEEVLKVLEGERPPVTWEMQQLAIWVFWKAWVWEGLRKNILKPLETLVKVERYEKSREFFNDM